MDCLKTIFFCCDWQPQPDNQNQRNAQRRVTRQSAPRTPKKKPTQQRPKRLVTKFGLDQVKLISEQEKKAGVKPAYSCPLCFQYYNKILACSQCSNLICVKCYITLENTSRRRKQLTKCAFCKSTTSDFVDHQKQNHSYWDTTNNGKGFLTKQQRDQVDNQLKKSPNKNIPKVEQQNLARIVEQPNDNERQYEESNHIIAINPSQEANRQQAEELSQNPFEDVYIRSQFEVQESNRNAPNPSIIQMESLNQQ